VSDLDADDRSAGGLGPYRSASRTHVGRVRAINEDRILDCSERGLWAVADGMGGHAAGDIAAEAAIAALQQLAEEERVGADAVAEALGVVNSRLYSRMRDGAPMSGATIAAMVGSRDAMTILWAGDCRVYRLRDGWLRQLTRDHSVVQELIDAGAIDAAQAARHPHTHVVTRALGAAETIALGRITVDVAAGDLYLICSDGLHGSRAQIAEGLSHSNGPLDAAADRLLVQALHEGGQDNISLILIGCLPSHRA
jgi:serine/threonine protein phosphatase PrpC